MWFQIFLEKNRDEYRLKLANLTMVKISVVSNFLISKLQSLQSTISFEQSESSIIKRYKVGDSNTLLLFYLSKKYTGIILTKKTKQPRHD